VDCNGSTYKAGGGGWVYVENSKTHPNGWYCPNCISELRVELHRQGFKGDRASMIHMEGAGT
jgi:hypothetical protein